MIIFLTGNILWTIWSSIPKVFELNFGGQRMAMMQGWVIIAISLVRAKNHGSEFYADQSTRCYAGRKKYKNKV
jgi:hypothetical protein